MDLEKLREMMRMLEASDLSELEVEENGLRIHLKKPRPKLTPPPGPTHPAPGIPVAAPSSERPHQETAAPGEAPASEIGEDLATIDAPMVGTFYAASAPGDPPFAEPGMIIEKDQTVCIVEAMKLMNEVTAKFRAEIVEVLVQSGEPVEFGQPLFTVRPVD